MEYVDKIEKMREDCQEVNIAHVAFLRAAALAAEALDMDPSDLDSMPVEHVSAQLEDALAGLAADISETQAEWRAEIEKELRSWP